MGAAWLVFAGAPGCADEPGALHIGAGPATGAGGAGGGEGSAEKAEAMFRALEADFLGECGSCHELGGSADTPFLGDPIGKKPDPYQAVTSWPGVLANNPKDSLLVTWPVSGFHSGPEASAALGTALGAWLAEEAKAVDDVSDEKLPTLPPFKPIVPGFNAVYLEPLGAEYAGMAVTFLAQELTPTTLSLTTLEVHTTPVKGVKLAHPLFSVYAAASAVAEPDPVDSFSNVEAEYPPGQAGAIGPGVAILTHWKPGGKLSLAFEAIATIDPAMGEGGGGGGAVGGPCKALAAFVENARPTLQQNCANACHGGNNATAKNAVDMSKLGTDDEAACGQIRNRVNLALPAESQLFLTTDPAGNASHPFKFGGDGNAHQAFENAVSQWIAIEKQ